jgi:hypothetical protein
MRLYNNGLRVIINYKLENNMDYQEWIFNEYILSVSPFTSSTTWSEFMGVVLAGTAVVTFGGVVTAWLNSFGFALIIPVAKVKYTTFITDTFEPSFYNPVTEALNGWGLDVVTSVMYQVYFYTNYAIVDVFFAYMSGDLTNDTNYA